MEASNHHAISSGGGWRLKRGRPDITIDATETAQLHVVLFFGFLLRRLQRQDDSDFIELFVSLFSAIAHY